MSWLAITGLVLLGLLLAFIGMQILMVRRMQRQKGKPAPQLDGKMGKRIKKGRATMFYFFSPQCRACKTMTPVVKSMARSDDGVFPVDITQDMGTARKFGVMATPTTIVVKEGVVAQVLVGAQHESTLRGLLRA